MTPLTQHTNPFIRTFQELHRNAVLLQLKRSRFGVNRAVPPLDAFPFLHQDQSHDQEIVDFNQPIPSLSTDPKCLRVQKVILQSPQLKEIVRLDGKLTQDLNRIALPTKLGAGISLIPIALIQHVDTLLTGYQVKRQTLIENFVDAYPTLVQQAQLTLSERLFNPFDYPEPDKIAACFKTSIQYFAFSTPGILQTVDPDLYQREIQKAKDKVQEILGEVQDSLRTAMSGLVTHLMDRLQPRPDGRRKTFRDSTITNLLDFLQYFDHRNLSGDTDLEGMVTQAKNLLSGIDSQALKTDTSLAQTVRQGLESIKTQLDDLIITKPSRQITFEEEPETSFEPLAVGA